MPVMFDPRVGGRVYDRGIDGSECQWARVLAYEPPNRVVINLDASVQRFGRPLHIAGNQNSAS